MELIDKQKLQRDMNEKLLKFKREADATNDHSRFLYIEGETHILRYYLTALLEGTFDDHSTQEEIKELRKRLEVAEEAAEIVSAKADARVIQAEQEIAKLRDALAGATIIANHSGAEIKQLREEISAYQANDNLHFLLRRKAHANPTTETRTNR